jgi:DNA-binding winged helix-turn-helix (wHTH) protein
LDALDAVRLPRRQRLLLDAMMAAWPRAISRGEFEAAGWEDVGDECFSLNAIETALVRIRRALPQGYSIRNSKGLGWWLILPEREVSLRRAA